MKPNNGIFQDAEFDDQPDGTWRTAKNVVPDGPNVVRNESGFKEVTGMPANMLVHGQVSLPEDKIVLFLIGDPTVNSTLREIGLVTDTTYTTLSSDTSIFDNWDINYPISGSHIVNSEGEIIIAYTDNNSPPGLINIGTGQVTLNLETKNDVRLFPETRVPNVYLDSVLNGGSLATGVYYFFFCYEAADGSTTNWMLPSNPVSITDGGIYDSYYRVSGGEAGSAGGKVITLRLTNLDSSYSKVKMAVLKKIGGVVSAEDVSSFILANNSGSDLIVSYSGDEATEDLLVEELVSDFATYQRVKAVKIFNDVLYLGNTKQENVLDYQPYANNIVLGWYAGDTVSLDSTRGSYKDPYIIYTKRTFEPGEVYAFYIRFLLKDGTSSPAFHIPGRPADYVWNDTTKKWDVKGTDERANATEAEYLGISRRAKYFHFNETATKNAGSASGDMGYWENLDERYPGQNVHNEYIGSGWDSELAIKDQVNGARNLYLENGGYIKHHRFPSLVKLSDWGIPLVEDNPDGSPLITISQTTSLKTWYDNALQYVLTNNPPLNENVSSGAVIRLWYNNNAEQYINNVIEYNLGFNFEFFYSQLDGTAFWQNEYRIVLYIASGDIETSLTYLNPYVFGDFNTLPNPGSIPAGGTNSIYIIDKKTVNRFSVTTTSMVGTVPEGARTILPNEGIYAYIYHSPQNPPITTGGDLGPKFKYTNNLTVTVKAEGLETGVVTGSKFSSPLGVIAKNIQIPPEIRNKIQGFDILYAEKTIGNSLSLGQSVILDQLEPLEAGNLNIADGGGARLYPPDMLSFRPNNKPTHIQVQLISKMSAGIGLYTVEWDNANPNNFRYNMPIPVKTDWQYPITGEVVGFTNTTKHFVRVITSPQYLQNDNSAGSINNAFREGCYYLEIEGGLATSVAARVLVTINTFKTNLYNSLYEQTMVSTGTFFQVEDSDQDYFSDDVLPESARILYGGDKFIQFVPQKISIPSSTVRAKYNIEDINPSINIQGVIVWMYVPMFSTMNYGLVHEGDEWFEKFFPAITDSVGRYMPTGFSVPEDYDNDGNIFIEGATASGKKDWQDKGHYLMTLDQWRGYNTDYTSINNVDQSGVPYDPDLTYVVENEALVTRSLKTQSANPLANIRKFLANDIYEMPKDKGGVEIIQSLGDTILIHMRHGLYRTVGKEIFTPSSTAEIVLGTGDIFEREPRLVAFMGPGGFTGTRSRFAAVSSRLGYFFIDDRQGKVFLLNDTLEEISAKGLRNFFRDYSKLSIDQDNPYYGVGYTACYDRKYNRIILSKRDGNNSWTISYAGDTQSWYSFHDYKPVAMFNSDAAYAAGADGKLFQMNNETTKGIYLDSTVNPSYIDAVFSFGTPGGVVARVRGFTWKTNVIDVNGINIRNATIDKVMVYNKHQNSGLIDLNSGPRLSPIPNSGDLSSNTRNVHNNWRFNKFRDISQKDDNSVKPPFYELNLSTIQSDLAWHKRKRFIDSFVVLRLQTDNEVGENGQNILYLYNADVEVFSNIVR